VAEVMNLLDLLADRGQATDPLAEGLH